MKVTTAVRTDEIAKPAAPRKTYVGQKAPFNLGFSLIDPTAELRKEWNLPEDLKMKIDRVMRRSVEFAFANPDSGREYVKQYAQEMDEVVRMKHIETYVNEFSIDLGAHGKNAIHVLLQKAKDTGLIKSVRQDIFVVSQKVVV